MSSTGLLKPGFVINSRFEIVRLLGQGGFAMVFEGHDRNLDRQVAIKVLHGAVLAKIRACSSASPVRPSWQPAWIIRAWSTSTMRARSTR